MGYYFNKVLKNGIFDDVIETVTLELKKEGFGVLTQIDVKETLKTKINVEFKKYRILGACNPHFAFRAISEEDKIGVFLPCNVIVEENDNGDIEVSAVDPVASMMAIQNKNLQALAMEVQEKLKHVIMSL
jgi:uncharacterized protein (DUF302 family)